MNAEQRRALLGEAAIAESRRLADTTTTVTPELLADLEVLLRRPPQPDRAHTTAA